jgi:hypothetical protein
MAFDLLKFNFGQNRELNHFQFFIPEKLCMPVCHDERIICQMHGSHNAMWGMRPSNEMIIWASNLGIEITIGSMYSNGCYITVADSDAAVQLRLMYDLKLTSAS